jgi:hypothetical protein
MCLRESGTGAVHSVRRNGIPSYVIPSTRSACVFQFMESDLVQQRREAGLFV